MRHRKTSTVDSGIEPNDVLGTSARTVASVRGYTASQFIGAPVLANEEFFEALDALNAIAERHTVLINVTSSFREPGARLDDAVADPAAMSNHLVGHAIDMNLQSRSGAFSSRELRRDNLPLLPPEICGVITDIRSNPHLRWGGDFELEDPVHVDDGLNHRAAARWHAKFRTLHPTSIAEGAHASALPTSKA